MKPEIIKATDEIERIEKKMIRVCAYCRVSTSMKDQLHSYVVQLEYYKRVTLNHLNWQLIDIYADEGISARTTRNREQFNQMIEDAMYGMFDMIICKSISRFSRDVVTALDICRDLKEKGIDVYFEKENIHTLFLTDETQFTYYASLAQSESESISKNIRWSTQKRMKQGTWVPYVTPYGYKVEEGELVKVSSEATITTFIFESYIKGMTLNEIAKELNEQGYVTRAGKAWRYSTIGSMLSNPIYHGELVAQKTFIEQTAPYHLKHNNNGQLPKYHYMENHEPYITEQQREQIEHMLAFRRSQKAILKSNTKYNNKYAISKGIYCHECGSVLKRIKANQSKDTTYFAYACKNHRENNKACSFVSCKEKTIERIFMKMVNKLAYHECILQKYLEDIRSISREANCNKLNELESLLIKQYEQADIARQHYLSGVYDKDFYEEIMRMIFDNAIEFRKQYRETRQACDLTLEIENTLYIQTRLRSHRISDVFDEHLYDQIIQEAVAIDKHTIKFILVNGLELEERI